MVKKIKEIRKKQSFTQEKLAEILDVDAKTISRLEKGYYFTTYENLEKLANALDVQIKDFFDFEYMQNKDTLKDSIITKISNMPIEKLIKRSPSSQRAPFTINLNKCVFISFTSLHTIWSVECLSCRNGV